MAGDAYLMSLVGDSGLGALVRAATEDTESYARRLLAEFARGQVWSLVLGTLLLPADSEPGDWTPVMAAQTAAQLQRACSPEDKATIQVELADALAFFFASGLVCPLISRTSTDARRADRQQMSAPIAAATGPE